ncbi:MAG: FHA domain-containing protein [Gammaproteobacteria bacterium]|nr:FHA domain-containing protein [Gammaproteobacteria bacterium]
MAKLILTQTGKADTDLLLEKDRVTLGRREDNDIVLDDGTVSGLHAIITVDGEGNYTIADQNSTNGSTVNGEKIGTVQLNSGDIVMLGQLRLIFSHSSSVGSDSTMVMSPGTDLGRMAAVKYLSGPSTGQVKVLDKGALSIGTKGTCKAQISRFGEDCYVTYVGGSQLPVVNGKKIGIDKFLLSNKDVVEVGPDKVEMLIE